MRGLTTHECKVCGAGGLYTSALVCTRKGCRELRKAWSALNVKINAISFKSEIGELAQKYNDTGFLPEGLTEDDKVAIMNCIIESNS